MAHGEKLCGSGLIRIHLKTSAKLVHCPEHRIRQERQEVPVKFSDIPESCVPSKCLQPACLCLCISARS